MIQCEIQYGSVMTSFKVITRENHINKYMVRLDNFETQFKILMLCISKKILINKKAGY